MIYRENHRPTSDVPTGDHAVGETAFTLLELAMVLGTLALLALTVWPAIAGAGSASDRAVCFNNLRQMLAAVSLYSTANADALPHSGWGQVGFSSGPDNWCHADRLVTGALIPSAEGRSGPYAHTNQIPFYLAGQLAQYVSGQRRFVCPLDWWKSMNRETSRYRGRPLKLTSYLMNSAVIGYGRLTTTGLTYDLSDFRPDDVTFWEPGDNPIVFHDASIQPSEHATVRHEAGTMIGTFGGSAEHMTRAEFSKLAGETTPPPVLPNRLWCNPGTPDGH